MNYSQPTNVGWSFLVFFHNYTIKSLNYSKRGLTPLHIVSISGIFINM